MTETVTNIETALCWTGTKYSDVLKIDRRVIAQALSTIEPDYIKGQSSYYHIRHAMRAIFASVFKIDGGGQDPKDRKLLADAMKTELEIESLQDKRAVEKSQLCPADDVFLEMRKVIQPTIQAMQTLPARLERDAHLTPEQAEYAQGVCDVQRDRLAFELAKLDAAEQEPAESL